MKTLLLILIVAALAVFFFVYEGDWQKAKTDMVGAFQETKQSVQESGTYQKAKEAAKDLKQSLEKKEEKGDSP